MEPEPDLARVPRHPDGTLDLRATTVEPDGTARYWAGRAGAAALEAQDARITELEAAIADVNPRHPRQETPE